MKRPKIRKEQQEVRNIEAGGTFDISREFWEKQVFEEISFHELTRKEIGAFLSNGLNLRI